MRTGDHAWMVPTGNGDAIRNHARLKHLNLPPLGGARNSGPLVTKTLLITAQAADGPDDRPRLIARDKVTGREVGSVEMPGRFIGNPMTYLVNGKQYIALTIRAGNVPEIVAFALP